MHWASVLLPAPLGPTTARISPGVDAEGRVGRAPACALVAATVGLGQIGRVRITGMKLREVQNAGALWLRAPPVRYSA